MPDPAAQLAPHLYPQGLIKAWGRAGYVPCRGAEDPAPLAARLGPLAQGPLDRHDSGFDKARQ